MSSLLVRNGTILTATDRYRADLFADHGVVTVIGRDLSIPADTTLDADGLLVMPGGVDVHTHLDLPVAGTTSSDDFESGTVAAAHGGTTTIIDFATPEPGESLQAGLEAWHRRADGQMARDIDHVVRHDGVTSFKLFLAYPGTLMVDDETLFRALRYTRTLGALVMVHAENGGAISALVADALQHGHTAPKFHAQTRPARAEAEATSRAVALAEMAGAPVYIVHLSCVEALEAVRSARQRGVLAMAETCPQYLCLSAAEYERDGFDAARFVMSPPLRDASNHPHLWRALATGDLQVVATDHCPFSMDDPPQKRQGLDDFSRIPNGAPGIETRLLLLWDGVRRGLLSAHRFVDVVATQPARIFGLWPRKGTIAVGSDADLVLWDPAREVSLDARALHMRVDYSPYEGRTVTGGPVTVVSRGEVIVDRGGFLGAPGRGQYQRRNETTLV